MADPNITPEEKLLRIIESPPDALRGMRRERRASGQDYKIFLKLLKAKYGERIKSFFNLRAVNTAIVFCAGILTVYAVFDFWLGMPRLTNVERLELMAKKMDIGDLSLGELDTLATYLQEIAQRNIFALPASALQESAAPVKTAEPSPEAQNLSSELKMVGIIWSNAPQAIIEEVKDGKTYLVNRGGKVKGARVKDILKDRVILSYDGQDVELM